MLRWIWTGFLVGSIGYLLLMALAGLLCASAVASLTARLRPDDAQLPVALGLLSGMLGAAAVLVATAYPDGIPRRILVLEREGKHRVVLFSTKVRGRQCAPHMAGAGHRTGEAAIVAVKSGLWGSSGAAGMGWGAGASGCCTGSG